MIGFETCMIARLLVHPAMRRHRAVGCCRWTRYGCAITCDKLSKTPSIASPMLDLTKASIVKKLTMWDGWSGGFNWYVQGAAGGCRYRNECAKIRTDGNAGVLVFLGHVQRVVLGLCLVRDTPLSSGWTAHGVNSQRTEPAGSDLECSAGGRAARIRGSLA